MMRGDPWSVNQTRRGSVSQGVCAVLFIRAHPSRRPRQPHPRAPTKASAPSMIGVGAELARDAAGEVFQTDRGDAVASKLGSYAVKSSHRHVTSSRRHVTPSRHRAKSRHHVITPPCHDVTLLCRHVTPSLPPCGSAALRQASVSGVHYWALTKARQLSSIRLEKPHSLSYQAMTLISLPLVLVWLASKIDDSGLWLKSIETSGRVL
jgi:hypothetical protein